MKKTKKQKLMSDLRRKMANLENLQNEKTIPQITPQVNNNSGFYSYKPKEITQTQKTNYFQNSETIGVKIDYSQIAKDLRKTIFLSSFIFFALLILKFLLKA